MLYPIMCLVRGIISLRGKATEGVTATPAFGLGSRRENIISHQHYVIAQKSNWRYQIFSNEKKASMSAVLEYCHLYFFSSLLI